MVRVRIRGSNNQIIETRASLTKPFASSKQEDQKTLEIKQIAQKLKFLDKLERYRQEKMQAH